MKRLLFALSVLSISLIPISAQADTINGIEIDIPDTMPLVKQTVEGDIVMNHYANDNEVVTVVVQKTGLNKDNHSLGNVLLFDFADSYSDYDHYVLTNERASNNDLDTLVQEFVYDDNNGWYYCLAGSRNFGDYVLSLSYSRLLIDLQVDYDDFIVLFTDYIFS